MRRSVQACCAAILAALVLAPGAEAAGDPSCAPPGSTPIAVAAPQALAQVFVLDEASVVEALEPVVGDAAAGQARVVLARTVDAGDGTLVPGAIVAEETVTLAPDPAAVLVALDPAPTLAAGTYALVVDPPGTESPVAWTRCADEAAGGARFRTLTLDWIPLANVTLSFTVHTSVPDRTPPETTITSAPPAYTTEAAPAVAFTSDDPAATFACSVDGGAFQACASPFAVALGEGPHTIAVAAADAAGNVDPTPAVAAFAVDRTGPQTSVTGPPAFTAAAAPSVSFSSDQVGSTFTCSLDGGTEAPCASPFATPLPEGPHTVAVRAIDPAGNGDPTPAVAGFTVDRTAPVLDLPDDVTVWATSVYGANVTYDASAADNADPDPSVTCLPGSGAIFPVGTTTVACNAVDAAGNAASGSFLVLVQADPGRAELSLVWDPTSLRIEAREPGGGAVEVDDEGITTRRGGHVTRAATRSAEEVRRLRFQTAIQLRSLRYDDETPHGLSRTLYTARGSLGTDGKLRRAVVVAAVARRAVVVLYTVERGRGTSRIMWLRSAARPRFETRTGLWVPSLVTSAGGASVDLVAGRASGGGAVSAPGHDADALGDVLERLVVVNADLTALERHDPLGA